MAKPRSGTDPRRQATQAALIEVAESLFAESGIDGVSLRQIGAAAGSSNPGVVAYHFGDKAGLVDAIFHHRLPAIDRRRGELLNEAVESTNAPTMYALLHALWQPLFEQLDTRGVHSYAGFMGALIRSQWGGRRIRMNADYPHTNRLAALIREAMPASCRQHFEDRMNMSAIMITGVLQLIDQLSGSGRMNKKQQALFDDALSMAAAACVTTDLSQSGE